MARKKKNSKKMSAKNAFKVGRTFYEFIKPQQFSLPTTIMKYLWQTPSNPKGYQKFIQSCKLFFAKNSILVFPSAFGYEGFTENDKYWVYCPKIGCKCYCSYNCASTKKIYLEKIGSSKIWLTCNLHIKDTYFPKILLSKLYRCDAKQVTLLLEDIYLKDIRLLASSAISLVLNNAVLDENGQHIFVEDFIDYFPLVENFSVHWDDKNPPCENFDNLYTILQKRTAFKEFELLSLPDEFAIVPILECLKKLKIKFQTRFFYSDASLPEVVNRLEKIVDKIIETKNFDYCPPFIEFRTLRKARHEKYRDMRLKIEEYRTGKSLYEKALEENAAFDKKNKIHLKKN